MPDKIRIHGCSESNNHPLPHPPLYFVTGAGGGGNLNISSSMVTHKLYADCHLIMILELPKIVHGE